MSSPTDGACSLHSRPARSTCKRCGLFLCDWCEKLAPSWGPGYCNECLHLMTPDTAHLGRMSLATMFVVVLMGMTMLGGLGGLSIELSRGPRDLAGVVWTGAIAIGPLLVVAFIFAQHWRRR